MREILIFALQVSVIARGLLYLTQPGGLLGFYTRFLYKLKRFISGPNSNYMRESNRMKLAEYIISPLGGCEACFTGQVVFWSGITSGRGAWFSLLSALAAVFFIKSYEIIMKK